jgi:N-acetylneuraminate epimerase
MCAGYRFIFLCFIWLVMGCKDTRSSKPELSWTSFPLFSLEDGQRGIGVAGPVTGVDGNFLIVAGGANFPGKMPWDGGQKVYYDSGAVYAFRDDSAPEKLCSFRLSMPLAYAACSSIPMGVVYAGGEDADGPSSRVRRLRFDEKSGVVLEDSLPDLPYEVTNGSMAAHENVLYFVGGENRVAAYKHVLRMDMTSDSPSWSVLDTLPNAISNAFAAIFLRNHTPELFILGGRQKSMHGESRIFQEAYRYKLSEKRWSACASFATTIAAGTIVGLDEPGMIVIGGDVGVLYRKTENLIRRIEDAHDPQLKASLQEERRILQSGHPGFTNQVWVYDPDQDSWDTLGSIPFHTPVTATAVYAGGRIYIPSGEIRPGVRSPFVLVGRFHLPNQ